MAACPVNGGRIGSLAFRLGKYFTYEGQCFFRVAAAEVELGYSLRASCRARQCTDKGLRLIQASDRLVAMGKCLGSLGYLLFRVLEGLLDIRSGGVDSDKELDIIDVNLGLFGEFHERRLVDLFRLVGALR